MRDISLYISGIVSMASYNMGCSYMRSDCFNIDNYMNKFIKEYKLSDGIILDEERRPFNELMKDLLRIDDKALDTFLFLINSNAGKTKKIYTISDHDTLSQIEKFTTFYILEEIYIVEFEKMMICFMIGNNE